METKIKFWEEAPGQQSSARLGFMAILLVALYISVYQVMTTGHCDTASFATFATIACGLKVWQKKQELDSQKATT